MKIGIDARFYGGESSKGLGRYTQKLIEYIQNIDDQNEYYIFLTKKHFDTLTFTNPHFHKVLAPYRWYTFSEQWYMPKLLKKYSLDIVHFPHYNVPLLYRKNFIVTIHDLILHHFPTRRASTLNGFFYFIKQIGYKFVIWNAIHASRKIITVSEFSKKDIVDTFRIKPDKVVVTYEAVDHKQASMFSSSEQLDILKINNITEPYLLYVGNAYPHKNLEILLHVFKDLQNSKQLPSKMVFVGKEDFFYKQLKELTIQLGLSHDVVFAGFVPDKDLSVLYRHAYAYIFPSLYEGFGLPPLESMSYGTPVLSSHTSSLPEILQDSALYFDPSDKNGIIKAILKIFQNPSLCEVLRKKGLTHVQKFHWKTMAEKTYMLYTRLS